MPVFALFVQELIDGDFAADKVQTLVLGQVQTVIFAKIKGFCRNNCTGVIDRHIRLDGYRHTGIVVGTSQIIPMQPIGEVGKSDTPVGEQAGYIEYFDFLILGCIFGFLHLLVVVEFGMGDLMDSSAYRLYLAHTVPDGDALIGGVEITVRVVCDGAYLHRHRGRTAQRFHKNLILLNIAVQIGSKLRQGLPLSLRHIKDGYHLIHGDFDFLFLHHNLTVCIQHRRFGVGIELDFLNLFLVGRGRDDLDAFFAFHHIAPKLVAPLIEACHMGGVGALHINEHGIVDRIAVEAAHGGQVLPVLIAFKQFLDAGFDTVYDFPHPVFAGLFLSHDDLLSDKKIAPLHR